MNILGKKAPRFNESGSESMSSYALFRDHKVLFYSHVAFMPIGFLSLMPLGIMLGVSKSSLHVLIQILTIVFAMFGFFFGKINSHGVPYLQYIKATYIILPVGHSFFFYFIFYSHKL
jgi:hypothetical protein